MKYFIIYDRLINIKNISLICPTAKFVSLLMLSNHKIEFLKPDFKKYETSVSLKETYGHNTPIAIYSIDDKEIINLDNYFSYNKVPQNFYKINIKINIKNVIEICTAYVVTTNSKK